MADHLSDCFTNALPGILTGSILGIGRAAGETAPIMFTAAAYFTAKLPGSIFDEVMALPYHIYVLATAGTNIEATRPIQYGTVLVLVAVVLSIDLIAIIIRSYMRKNKKVVRMDSNVIIKLNKVNFYYGHSRALTDITMNFRKNKVSALIGPSGCGKSTLLRLLNRMNDLSMDQSRRRNSL